MVNQSKIQSKGAITLRVKEGNRAVQMEIFKGTNMTREEIRKYAQAMSNTLKKKGWNGAVKVAIYYDNLKQPREGSWTQAGDKVSIFQPYSGEKEPKSFTEFRI